MRQTDTQTNRRSHNSDTKEEKTTTYNPSFVREVLGKKKDQVYIKQRQKDLRDRKTNRQDTKRQRQNSDKRDRKTKKICPFCKGF